MLIDHYIRIAQASATKTVCVDFDGVLAQWKPGMALDAIGTPIPQGLALAKLLIAKGFTVVILTARPAFLHAKVEKWLASRGIDVQVTSEKPPAIAYIDDRAVRFEGNIDKVLEQVEGLRS